MSTYIAVFRNSGSAKAAVLDLVRGGVRPEDISLVSPRNGSTASTLSISNGSVGDASYYVGRSDDPQPAGVVGAPYQELTTVEASLIGGVDTSDADNDVDSVDQAEDSQELSDEMTYPIQGISNSEHQRDDLNLAIETGFPTVIPMGDVDQSTGEFEDELEDQIETIELPSFGVVMGGGLLATQALDLAWGKENGTSNVVITYLRDEGVPTSQAQDYEEALAGGCSLLAVTVTPGEVDEGAVEAVAERHQAEQGELYDSPRYRNQ